MAVYQNQNQASPVTSVEFSDVLKGNMAFFHLSGPEGKEALERLLTDNGQVILSEAAIRGKPVIVTQGSKSQEQLLKALSAAGEQFALPEKKSKFNPWAWRGGLSVVGQTLQILSAQFSSKGLDAAVFGFAVPNLVANGINFIFGSQKSPDKYHMLAFKQLLNDEMANYVPDRSLLPAPDSVSKAAEKKTAGQIFSGFIRRSSVTFGEVGLRLLGSVSLAFPYTKWKESVQLLAHGKMKQAYNVGKNPDRGTFIVGLMMLTGKFMGFGAKIEDPYNPKKHTALDTLREKYIFKGSSVVEGAAAGYMAYDRLKNKRIILNKGKPNAREVPDYFGFAGNAVFDVGYAARYFAPFGTKVLDMPELYAHVARGLSQVLPDRAPEAVANISAKIAENLGEKSPPLEKIYKNITSELYNNYQVAISAPAVEPPAAPMQAGNQQSAQNREYLKRNLERGRFASAEEMVKDSRAEGSIANSI